MRFRIFAVIDTNVVVSGTRYKGLPNKFLGYIETGNVIPLFDERILSEYYDVMNRPYLGFKPLEVFDALYSIVSNGIFVNEIEKAKIELSKVKDIKDIPFYEVKESTQEFSSYLVTGNLKDFPTDDIDDSIVNTYTILRVMREGDKLLTIFEKGAENEYEKDVEKLIQRQLTTSKFESGAKLAKSIFNISQKKIRKEYFDNT